MIIENDVEKYLIKKCEKMGALCWKWTSPGRRGVPDRIVFCLGKTYLTELKRPGEKPRLDQKVIHDKLKKVGIPVHVLDSKDEVDKFLKLVMILGAT